MSSKEVRAGRAFVEIALRDNLEAGLKQAASQLRAFAATTAAIVTPAALMMIAHMAEKRGRWIYAIRTRSRAAFDRVISFALGMARPLGHLPPKPVSALLAAGADRLGRSALPQWAAHVVD